MARIYIDGMIGTGGSLVIDLDPNPPWGTPGAYHWLDGIENGTLVTTTNVPDHWRPLNNTVGPSNHIRIMDSRIDGESYFVIADDGVDVSPAGSIDLGRPGNTLDAIMPTGKANEIRALLGLTLDERNRMRSNRIRQAIKWLRWEGLKGSEDEMDVFPGRQKYRLWQATD